STAVWGESPKRFEWLGSREYREGRTEKLHAAGKKKWRREEEQQRCFCDERGRENDKKTDSLKDSKVKNKWVVEKKGENVERGNLSPGRAAAAAGEG
ncbi:hypothetical protein KUCAC02_034904, partial [Chaenocephalus aceratus]